MRILASLLASVAALATPSFGLEVSVCGDATYDLPDDRGVICASADPVPPGTACPLKGDKASTECFENLPSYDGNACVAPEDAVCALVTDKTWGCVLPSIGCGDKTITTAAPALVDQCETWDYDEDSSASTIDDESLFDRNEDYDESWFVEVTKVTVLFACETDKPTAAPTSMPTPAPTTDTTDAPVSEPTPAPTDSAQSSASNPIPAPTSHSEDSLSSDTTYTATSSSDTTDTATSDSGDASASNVTPEPTTAADSSSGSTESKATPAPSSNTAHDSATAAPSSDSRDTDTTGSSELEPTPAPTSDTDGAQTSDSADGSTPEVTPAATKSEAQQEIDDNQTSSATALEAASVPVSKTDEATEATDGSKSTKQSTGFTDVMLLSEPSNFIGTLKPASIPEAPNAYDKPSR